MLWGLKRNRGWLWGEREISYGEWGFQWREWGIPFWELGFFGDNGKFSIWNGGSLENEDIS